MTARRYPLLLYLITLTGCVNGGTIGPNTLQGSAGSESGGKIIQSYTSTDGTGHAAIMSRNAAMTLALKLGTDQYTLTTHWQDRRSDHFAVWIDFLSRKGAAIEFVAPFDRKAAATMSVYDQGHFVLITQDDIQRPTPYGAFQSYSFVPNDPD